MYATKSGDKNLKWRVQARADFVVSIERSWQAIIGALEIGDVIRFHNIVVHGLGNLISWLEDDEYVNQKRTIMGENSDVIDFTVAVNDPQTLYIRAGSLLREIQRLLNRRRMMPDSVLEDDYDDKLFGTDTIKAELVELEKQISGVAGEE